MGVILATNKSWGPDPPRTSFHKSDLKSSGHSKSKPTLGSSKPWDSTPSFFGRRLIVLNLVVFVVQTFLVLQCDMFVFETSHTCLLGAKHGRNHLDLMWLQNQRMMLFKCMVQLWYKRSFMLLCFFSVYLLVLWYHDIWRRWFAGSMFHATLDMKGFCFCCLFFTTTASCIFNWQSSI